MRIGQLCGDVKAEVFMPRNDGVAQFDDDRTRLLVSLIIGRQLYNTDRIRRNRTHDGKSDGTLFLVQNSNTLVHQDFLFAVFNRDYVSLHNN